MVSGVDTVHVQLQFQGWPSVWPWLDMLSSLRDNLVEFAGFTWLIRGHGIRQWPIVLESDVALLAMAYEPRGEGVFPVWLELRSLGLWRFGLQDLVSRISSSFSLFGAVYSASKVSRLDLCADVWGPDVDVDLSKVVSRSRERSLYYSGSTFQGLSFGRGDIVCRIYRKDIEAKKSAKVWFFALWHDSGWDGVSPVWRVEYQLRRDFFRSLRIDSLDDLSLSSLWYYLTSEWLSFRELDNDNLTRRSISPWWSRIQGAFGVLTPLLKHVTISEKRLKRLLPGLAGYLSSVMAVAGVTRWEDIRDYIEEVLAKDAESRAWEKLAFANACAPSS